MKIGSMTLESAFLPNKNTNLVILPVFFCSQCETLWRMSPAHTFFHHSLIIRCFRWIRVNLLHYFFYILFIITNFLFFRLKNKSLEKKKENPSRCVCVCVWPSMIMNESFEAMNQQALPPMDNGLNNVLFLRSLINLIVRLKLFSIFIPNGLSFRMTNVRIRIVSRKQNQIKLYWL